MVGGNGTWDKLYTVATSEVAVVIRKQLLKSETSISSWTFDSNFMSCFVGIERLFVKSGGTSSTNWAFQKISNSLFAWKKLVRQLEPIGHEQVKVFRSSFKIVILFLRYLTIDLRQILPVGHEDFFK